MIKQFMQGMSGSAARRRVVACAFIVALVAIVVPSVAVHAQTPVAQAAPQVQLVAVQMTLSLDDYWTKDAFEAKIREQMDAVAAATDPDLPTLVVFPEDVGLMLVVQGMEQRLAGIDSIEEAIGKAVTSHVFPLAWTRLIRWKSWVPALLLHKNRLMAEAYFEVFSGMAREHEVYLIAGSAVLPPYRILDGVVQWEKGPDKHRVFNTSYLFGPDGLVIGKQDKVFLIELEEEAALNLNAGSLESLQVFDTPIGRIGIAICLDGFNDEVVDRLVEQGAQILVQPSANPGAWDDWQQEDWLRGSYEKVALDGRFAYAINPMLNGPLWDVAFYGQSSIIARDAFEATSGYVNLEPAAGFISVAASDRSEEVLVAVVPHPDYVE
jgi:predicted amidohydrolase